MPRLPSERRRAAILDAAIPLFSERGFHGVTTRELAEAAGISEALLYKHFTSKEELFRALPAALDTGSLDDPSVVALLAMEPGVDKLVALIAALVEHLVDDTSERAMSLPRLVARSLAGDGELARAHFDTMLEPLRQPLEEAYRAACDAGDIARPLPASLALLLPHHLAFATKLLAMPGAVIDYGVPRAELAQHITHFCLRGLGVVESRFDPTLAPIQESPC